MIIPVLHRLLIKPNKLEDINEDIKRARKIGLEIPLDNAQRAQASVDQGVVLDIGDTAFRDFGSESPVKIGDRIAYAKFAGKFIKDSTTGDELLLLNDEDVVCILKD